jgi:hypothetical protein
MRGTVTSSDPAPGLSRLERLPPRVLPLLYLGMAHLGLIGAGAMIAFDPGSLTGFFYQPRTLAVVHLVTLGWITGSILGALYIVGPLALRMPMPARLPDYVAFALYAIGSSGIVGHFFVAEYRGLAWSAGTAIAGLALVAAKVLRSLGSAPIDRAVKLHIAFACLNLLAAAAMGLLIGIDKVEPFMPGRVLSNVYAHAHLAALGWATMMVLGVGYRLIPMLLPSAVPHGRSLYASAILLESGTLGLFLSLQDAGRLLPWCAALATAGLAVFGWQVRWMTRHPRRPPLGLVRPDYGVLQALQAIFYLGLCAVIGLGLTVAPLSDLSLRVAGVYGVLGLFGFLAQMVAGVEARLLPLYVVGRADATREDCGPAPNPHTLADRRLQAATFCGFAVGVPLLAAGMGLQRSALCGTAGAALLGAAIAQGINALRVLRGAGRSPSTASR